MRIALGVMSGTSLDGIDLALVAFGKEKDELLLLREEPFPPSLKKDLFSLIHSLETGLGKFTKLHYQLGEAYALACERTIAEAVKKKLIPNSAAIEAIGVHGQTVFHDGKRRQTLQMGEFHRVAARTGIVTVGDFRSGDTARGGEGAPLLPHYHRRLLGSWAEEGAVVHNLGGISNFTYVGPKKIFSLDTGPASCLMDAAMQKRVGKNFDKNGATATKGKPHQPLLSWLAKQKGVSAYRKRNAPKSTGRELFHSSWIQAIDRRFPKLSTPDLICTLTHFSALLAVESYQKEVLDAGLPLKRIVLAGGGSYNSYLCELLAALLPQVEEWPRMEQLGSHAKALEAQAFAFFALEHLDGHAITYPSTTGVEGPVVCGKRAYP
jgi:anhydro-N-acetylmuramic acid kinase